MHEKNLHKHSIPCVCSKIRKGAHCYECADMHASKKHPTYESPVEKPQPTFPAPLSNSK